MKGTKCPHCGKLYPYNLNICYVCGWNRFKEEEIPEEVELIDWEEELITKNEYNI